MNTARIARLEKQAAAARPDPVHVTLPTAEQIEDMHVLEADEVIDQMLEHERIVADARARGHKLYRVPPARGEA